MTSAEIQELFILAAEIDRRLPDTARPAKLKAMNVGYVHSFVDIRDWPTEDQNELRWAWLNPDKQKTTPDQVTTWERANELMVYVPNEDQRRCLWHWAIAKAGGRPFSKWCRDEGILRETGRWRKENAVKSIFMAISFAGTVLNHEKVQFGSLPNQEEISDKQSIIGAVTAWIAPGSRPEFCDIDRDLERYDWAEVQNARRRERERKRRAA